MSPIEAPTAKLKFNPLDRRLIADPYPDYERLRATEPVHWNDVLKAWVLTSLDDVRDVLVDPGFRAVRSSVIVAEIARRTGRDWSDLTYFLDAVLFFKEGPSHERDRRTLSKVMNRIRLSELDPAISEMTRKLIAPLRDRHAFDLITDFAEILPQQVMAYILGLPLEDVVTFSGRLGELTLVFDAASIDTYDRANQQVRWALGLIGERITEAGPDSNLRVIYEGSAGEGAAKLREAAAITLFAYRVGAETTIGLLGVMAKVLIEQPSLREALLAGRTLVETVVSEVLRLESNVQRVGRIAMEPRRVGGVDIAVGDRLLLLLGAANRDPKTFEPADQVSLTGQASDDLAFGVGKHFCLGASLARLEGRVGLAALLDMPLLELDGDPIWFGGRTIRRLTSLPVRQVATA